MTTTQEALRLALDALEVTEPTPNDRRCNPERWEQHQAAIAAIEKALAEPEIIDTRSANWCAGWNAHLIATKDLDFTKAQVDSAREYGYHDGYAAAVADGLDWRSATGYATPAEYRADRDKGLDAALAEPKQEPVAELVIRENGRFSINVVLPKPGHEQHFDAGTYLLYAATIPEPTAEPESAEEAAAQTFFAANPDAAQMAYQWWRTYRAEPKQEPVAWVKHSIVDWFQQTPRGIGTADATLYAEMPVRNGPDFFVPLYAAPQPAPTPEPDYKPAYDAMLIDWLALVAAARAVVEEFDTGYISATSFGASAIEALRKALP